MSRALNIDASLDEVVSMAARHKAEISAIEALEPSGTRVVFTNADGAAVVARAYGRRVLTGAVIRTPWRQRRIN